ncbi:hypothetical protein XH92_17340 [Bradyrhizobium sp. CCBAU 53421]|nr:hypothetical protein XH92_17340 [Bradyrhizobium sp. CCBAU 53421]
MKFVVGCLVAIIIGGVLLVFGTVSPCGMLREVQRKQDSVAAVLPDAVLDLALAAKYGSLTPGKCVALLLQLSRTAKNSVPQQPTQPVAVTKPVQPTDFQTAMQAASTVMAECRDRRLRGEIKTRLDSVQCSNPRVTQIFSAAHYRYMDLIEMMNSRREAIAKKQDQGQMTEEQAATEAQSLMAQLANIERTRDLRSNLAASAPR